MSDPVTEFERKFAGMIGADYAIAVNSGTSALHTALEALSVRGGEVIMPALAPGLVAFPIIAAGAKPVFADVDPITQLINVDTVRPRITEKTKAIIAVALHGLSCDIDHLQSFGVPIVEDCAQALFARYKDGFAGTFGAFGCYSFEKKKHLTTGSEGGMLVTSQSSLARRARQFAHLGYNHLDADGGTRRVPQVHPDYRRFDRLGLNYRLSEAQSQIGLERLAAIGAAIIIRQEIGHLWGDTVGVKFQPHAYSADNVFYSAAWDYPHDWQALHDRFVKAGGDGFYAAPLPGYQEPALCHLKGYRCGQAERLQKHLVCLKTHYSLPEAKRQAEILKGCL